MKKWEDITLIEWNFQYYLSIKYPFKHRTQLGQIHHALYCLEKNSQYMLFCDFDEFISLSSPKLILSSIDENENENENKILEFRFLNVWVPYNDNILEYSSYIPKKGSNISFQK